VSVEIGNKWRKKNFLREQDFCLTNNCLYESIDNGRSYYQESVNISDCIFNRISFFVGNGGIICVDGGSFVLCVSYSAFINCSSFNQGGGVFFNSASSYFKMVCAFRCASLGSDDHFAYLCSFQFNHVEHLSTAICSYESKGFYSIRLFKGMQLFHKTNSSSNKVYQVSGMGTWSPNQFSSIFCTFSNGHASNGLSICFYSNSGMMSFSNIINNTSPNYGNIHVSGFSGQKGSYSMEYCIFGNNHDTLFSVYYGSLGVSHSYIAHTGTLSAFGSLLPSMNNSMIRTNNYIIDFFNSQICNYDTKYVQTVPFNRNGSCVLFAFPCFLLNCFL